MKLSTSSEDAGDDNSADDDDNEEGGDEDEDEDNDDDDDDSDDDEDNDDDGDGDDDDDNDDDEDDAGDNDNDIDDDNHVDVDDAGPYSATRGFWFSHMGWMLREYQATRYTDYNNCKDLQKEKIVMWQHKYYLPIVLVSNFGITALLGWLNGNILGMMLLAGIIRIVLVYHVTFFINSLAHMWGSRPFTDKNTARDNGMLAFFTFGEGYHNFHHIFEYDYRNGVKWWQFDPTKWLIKGLSFLGLTTNLRTCPEERIEKAKLEMQLKYAQDKAIHLPNAEEIVAKIQHEYDILMHRMVEYYATKKRLVNMKKKNLQATYERLELDFKYRELKQTLALQKQKWRTMYSFYLEPQSA